MNSYDAVALCCSELYYLVDSADDAVGVLTTGSSEVGLSAAALDELGCLIFKLVGHGITIIS